MMSVSIENFLKNIYLIKYDFGEKASSTKLSQSLGVSHAAITDMAQKLSERGLIDYRKYQELKLTPAGKKEALGVIRRHRLWELFLSTVLNMPPDAVHNEAEMLEHQTSELLLSKIDAYLGFPSYDPHGDPIPDASGNMPSLITAPIMKARQGITYKIGRIQFNNEECSDFFKRHDFSLNRKIKINKIFKNENSIDINYEGKQFILNSNIAECIHVKPIE